MTADSEKILLVIAGPTAAGKTETAIRVARTLGTEIISADSRQFYRELNIGTAKPDSIQLSEVPHHFIGHISIHEEYNVSRFETEALALLAQLFSKYRVAVMAGGSGMYIDAVCHGLDDLPDADPSIRLDLRTGFDRYGIQFLRNRLLDLDPDYYSEVDKSNPQRLIRALEVCMTTGVPFSSQRLNSRKQRPYRVISTGLMTTRDKLFERISNRVDRMMESGLEEEARELFPLRHLNSLQTVGYRELFDHFEQRSTLAEAVEKIKTNTRRYAKRQLTWFRRDPDRTWYDPTDEQTVEKIVNIAGYN
jgi:tRNA dimethylallyltransferase